MHKIAQHAYLISRHFAKISLPLILPILVSLIVFSPSMADAATTPAGPGQNLANGQLWSQGKGKLTQTAAFIQAKNAHLVNPRGIVRQSVSQSTPSSFLLISNMGNIEEPLAYGYDDSGKYYTDYYNWYICGPGSAAVVEYFWPDSPWAGLGNYSDPHTQLYWQGFLGRPEIMYLAHGFTPPNSGWTSPGIETYNAYPSAYSTFSDMVIGLNYESSGQSSNWQNYFYISVAPGNLSASSLLSDVEYDTYNTSVPLVVSVNDGYLPDWQGSGSKWGSHFIAIVGYDNNAGTYSYVETCGSDAAGCETLGNGEYSISQSILYNAIENDNGNGGLIW